MSKPTKKYICALGRRKRSTARIRLHEGKGQILVNEKPINEYFRGVPETLYLQPFNLTKLEGKYFATAKIIGGGSSGQLGAFVHGVSRAFLKIDGGKYRQVLKSAGLLTRDSRERERRKAGLAHGARAGKQSPKR